MDKNIIEDKKYAELIQNLEIYEKYPIVNAKQIIELFDTSTNNIITNCLNCDIKKSNSDSIELKFKNKYCYLTSQMRNYIYIIDNYEAIKVLVWIIKIWSNNVLNVMEKTHSSPFLLKDSGIHMIREWFSVIGYFNVDEENEDEEYEDDIISTLKMVKDSMSMDSIKQWSSSDIYSYSEYKLYELSIPTHHHNIKTANLSDMPFDWDHHTITEKTMYNILKWIIKDEIKTLSMNSKNTDNDDYIDNMKTLKKIKEWVDILV